jgi:hypothetical protein
MAGAMVAYQTPDRTGTAHAVLGTGDRRSLCGRTMATFGGRPWPLRRDMMPADITWCPTCARQVYREDRD